MTSNKSFPKLDKCEPCPARSRSAFAKLNSNDLVPIDHLRSTVQFNAFSELSSTIENKVGFYCIRSGYLKVNTLTSSGPKAARIVGPGDLILYGDCFSKTKNFATAFSGGESCFFEFAKFQSLQTQYSKIAIAISEMLCRIIALKDQRIASLENHSVSSRIASLLLSLREKFGTRSSEGYKIDISIDRPTLAMLAGTVPETFARTLTRFENDGIIYRAGRKIVIKNLAELNEVSRG